ncbi:MAG: hypothetical protein ACRDJH_13625, partial [Thermomicrobiales bacterium]
MMADSGAARRAGSPAPDTGTTGRTLMCGAKAMTFWRDRARNAGYGRDSDARAAPEDGPPLLSPPCGGRHPFPLTPRPAQPGRHHLPVPSAHAQCPPPIAFAAA